MASGNVVAYTSVVCDHDVCTPLPPHHCHGKVNVNVTNIVAGKLLTVVRMTVILFYIHRGNNKNNLSQF